MKFKTRFTPSTGEGFEFKEPSLTKSEFANDCDINTIVSRFRERGIDPDRDLPGVQFRDDFVDSPEVDLHSALNALNDVSDAFDELPASERAKFDNDYMAWFDSLQVKPQEEVPSSPENQGSVGEKVTAGTGTSLDVTVPADTNN